MYKYLYLKLLLIVMIFVTLQNNKEITLPCSQHSSKNLPTAQEMHS